MFEKKPRTKHGPDDTFVHDSMPHIVCHTVCGSIELKITLTSKSLARPLVEALLTPFLTVYNKKRHDEPPLTVALLAHVEINGTAVPDLDVIAGELLVADARVNLFGAPPENGGPPPSLSSRVAELLTIVISTSASRLDAEEQAEHTCAVLDSFAACEPLHGARKILVFDAVPTAAEAEELSTDDGGKWREAWRRQGAYDAYCSALQGAKASGGARWEGVEMMWLPSHAHLVGSVRAALGTACTPWALITQHDLVIDAGQVARAWPGIWQALQEQLAHCITLNRDSHAAVRAASYWHFEPALDLRLGNSCSLTAVVGFSDQSHFVDLKWYRSAVLGLITAERRTCMEHVVHGAMRAAWMKGGEHSRTFLLGRRDGPPAVHDLVHGAINALDQWGELPHLVSEWRKYVAEGETDNGAYLKIMRSKLGIE